MSVVKFTETVFSNQNKEGALPGPDSDGYYTLVLGGLNCFNTAGEYYVADGVVDMFRDSSVFMRRIQSGSLYAEVGHPRRQPGMSYEDFYRRIIDIDDTNICGHISDITLDMTYGQKNPGICNPEFIAVMGKVKPAGPKAEALRLSLENRKQNTAFSVRGLTDNKERNGRTERKLTQIITYDHVTEPGIKAACKAYVPGLESLQVYEVSDILIDKNLLKETVAFLQKDNRLATESNKALYNEILSAMAPAASTKLPKW